MPNRDDQETVIVQELIDERFRDIFEACSTNKATIIMLVLNHTQEHLYSVQNGGIFQSWDALQGPDMRARLYFVHVQVGLPELNAILYDDESWRTLHERRRLIYWRIWALTFMPMVFKIRTCALMTVVWMLKGMRQNRTNPYTQMYISVSSHP